MSRDPPTEGETGQREDDSGAECGVSAVAGSRQREAEEEGTAETAGGGRETRERGLPLLANIPSLCIVDGYSLAIIESISVCFTTN